MISDPVDSPSGIQTACKQARRSQFLTRRHLLPAIDTGTCALEYGCETTVLASGPYLQVQCPYPSCSGKVITSQDPCFQNPGSRQPHVSDFGLNIAWERAQSRILTRLLAIYRVLHACRFINPVSVSSPKSCINT